MKKADFIVIGTVALVVAVLLFFLYGMNSGSGDLLIVEVDGKKTLESISLSDNTELKIETDGGGVNVLTVRDGEAVISSANCPDGICAGHKPISKPGESIICLPHKVVVSVVSEDGNEAEIDAVA